MTEKRLSFWEFFAGGGMARLGLGSNWQCTFANDNSPKKAAAYHMNFPDDGSFHLADVASIEPNQLPGRPDLVWASFPCQDLSLAGDRLGFKGKRSSTFWTFWRLISAATKNGREPRVIVIENVVGTLTSHRGRDFQAIGEAVSEAGYRFGVLVVDAVSFVPQSRPRMFLIAASADVDIPEGLTSDGPNSPWSPKAVVEAQLRLPGDVSESWVWWQLPKPRHRRKDLAAIIEDSPTGVEWHSVTETRRLLAMMSKVNRSKVKDAQRLGVPVVGTIYKRTRPDSSGVKRQRAEVRFDGISGCLRTPAGGSSRQTIILVHGSKVRSRLLSPREAARLMGVTDKYRLPERYNEAYHLMGDGLVVPVVRWLEKHLIRPVAEARRALKASA